MLNTKFIRTNSKHRIRGLVKHIRPPLSFLTTTTESVLFSVVPQGFLYLGENNMKSDLVVEILSVETTVLTPRTSFRSHSDLKNSSCVGAVLELYYL